MARIKAPFVCPYDNKTYTLPANLVKDNKGRKGRWRYRHPEKGLCAIEHCASFSTIELTTAQAIELANALNKTFYGITVELHVVALKNSLAYFLPEFIAKEKSLNASRIEADSFRAALSLTKKFCAFIGDQDSNKLTLADCHQWFDTLEYYQQKCCRFVLCQFIDFLYIKDAVSLKTNPFKAKSVGEVRLKPKPSKDRRRMDKEDFAAILQAAEFHDINWLVTAMKLGVLLRLRRQDIVELRYDNISVSGGYMYCKILKSENQKGAEQGEILLFDLREPSYQEALQIIEDSKKTRNIALADNVTESCPYVIHERPRAMPTSIPKTKTHYGQVTKNRLSKMFKMCRDSNPIINEKAEREGLNPTTFHEIRSLGARMDRDKGLSIGEISRSLAHSGIDVTKDKYLSENMQRIEVAKTLVSLSDFA